MDAIATYASSKGWTLSRYIILVEGTTDEALFMLADRLARNAGHALLGNELSFVAAGERDRGGTFGVGRELITLRAMSNYILDANGSAVYRVVGLLDDDHAGRRIISDILRIDRGAIEFRDIFRLRPVMPYIAGGDPLALKSASEADNMPFRGLDWEAEDLLSERVLSMFDRQHPAGVIRRHTVNGRTHLELTRIGKRQFHTLVHREANLADLAGVVDVVRSFRCIFGLPDTTLP